MEINGVRLFFLVRISFCFHAVLLSFGQTFWIQSVQFEVFTLNNLFICIVLYLTVKFYYYYWREENQHRILCFISVPNSVPHRVLRSLHICSVALQPTHDCFLLIPHHSLHSFHPDQNASAHFQAVFPACAFVFGRTFTLFLLGHRFLLSKKG